MVGRGIPLDPQPKTYVEDGNFTRHRHWPPATISTDFHIVKYIFHSARLFPYLLDTLNWQGVATLTVY